MSKYVIEIPQSKGCEPIWEQKLRRGNLLPGQHFP
jgi:hypothetical protein